MELDAPTLSSLNTSQTRALVLRDHLRWLDPVHLDSFLEGILPVEPPAYNRINSTVYPALSMVTLKDTANRYDLGNIYMANDDVLPHDIYHGFLTNENGRIEIRTEEAMPADDADLATVPIHFFVGRNMSDLFRDKCNAIFARMSMVNGVRQAAYKSVNQPPLQLLEGETLSTSDLDSPAPEGPSSQSRKSKTRLSGEVVSKHVSNKHKRIGLDTISEETKAATFDTIPEKVKVDLFDSVFKTAMPNFDNLMTAAWNVVSVYSNVVTDFPELHRSITELKSVLQDFEEGMGKTVKREEPPMRRYFTPPSQDGANDADGANRMNGAHGANDVGGANGRPSNQPAPNAAQDRASDATPTPQEDTEMTFPEEDSLNSLFNDPEPEATINEAAVPEAQRNNMPPPSVDSLMDMIKRHDDTGDVDSDNDDDNHNNIDEPKPTPRIRASPANQRAQRAQFPQPIEARRLDRRSRPSSTIPDPELLRRLSSSLKSTPEPKPSLRHPHAFAVQPPFSDSSAPNSRDSTPRNERKRSMSAMPTSELRTAYKARKAELIETFGAPKNVPLQYKQQMVKMQAEIKAREDMGDKDEEVDEEEEEDDRGGKRRKMEVRGGGGMFLGNSVLGGKKSGGGELGMAPVAQMMPGRKEGGGGKTLG